MTREEKQLLLKDLSCRIPYGVIVNVNGKYNVRLESVNWYEEVSVDDGSNDLYTISEVKPYLFPLSSMTDEMMEELNAEGFFKYRDTITNVSHIERKEGEIYTYIDIESMSFLTEFFHSHHIDYQELIEKGLAIDCTNLNIYGCEKN